MSLTGDKFVPRDTRVYCVSACEEPWWKSGSIFNFYFRKRVYVYLHLFVCLIFFTHSKSKKKKKRRYRENRVQLVGGVGACVSASGCGQRMRG